MQKRRSPRSNANLSVVCAESPAKEPAANAEAVAARLRSAGRAGYIIASVTASRRLVGGAPRTKIHETS